MTTLKTLYDIITMEMVNNETFYVTEMNLSGTVPPPTPHTGIYSTIYWNTLIVSIVILMISSFVGNMMIILATILYKSMRTKTNIAILNLAVADIGVTLLDMPVSLISVIKHGENWLPQSLCNLNAFCNALFLIASIHSLMYISVHKYFSLVKPLDHFITKRRAIAMIIVAWLTGFICGISPIFGWTTNEFKYEQGATQCGPSYPETPKQKAHGIFIFVVGFLIPLMVLFFTYTAIFIEVDKFSKRLLTNTSVAEVRIVKQKIRITVTLFIIVVAFLVCWLPYMTYATWAIVKGYESIPIWFNSFAYWSGYLSCVLNPIIYAWRTKTFRTAFLNIVHCKSKMEKITAELSPHFPKKYPVVGTLVRGPAIINQQNPPDTNENHTATSKKTKTASITVHMPSRISGSTRKKMSRKEDCCRLFGNLDEPQKDHLQMASLEAEKVGGNIKLMRNVFSCPCVPSMRSFDGFDLHRQISF